MKEDEPGPALKPLGEKCPLDVPMKEISDSLGISLVSVKARYIEREIRSFARQH